MSKIALFRMKSFQLLVVVALIVGVGIAFAVDTDNDGMSDAYENFFKLNSTNALDAAEDPDADTLANLAESALWTDPNDPDTDADGFNDNVDDNPLSRAVILWGNPDFTTADSYAYTGPDWWLGAGKIGGIWSDGSCWQLPAGEQGLLYIDIDRSVMNSNLVLSLLHQNVAECEVYLDLGESNGTVAVEDLFGDIADGDGSQELGLYMLPLAAYTNASRIIIDATAADESYIVWATTLYVDMDGDGLDADQEAQVGTSDENADCDGDSLTDYEEVIIALSNPLTFDSDGDGLDDAQEILAGSNLLKSDSDEDGLSDSEELVPYYYLSDNPVTWAEAKAFAEVSGGHLAVITSLDELNVIKAALPAVKQARPWMGATDVEEDGVWKWITGETFDYARWGAGEPNNYNGPQMYLRFCKNFYWDDAGESNTAAILIEYESGLDPLSADTDGDGLSDVDEITLYKSNAHAFDSDGDGLSDGVEAAQGLDLNLVDSDQDGIRDSDELDMGLNPLSADTDGDGLNDGDELSQRYQLIHSLTTWPDAKVFAEESGGYLAVLTSGDEMGEVATVSTNVRSAHPWIGGTDSEEDGLWQWVNGEEFDYSHWAANEPNNHNGSQMYLRLSTHYLRWDDEGAELKTAFLIEYDEGLDPFNPDSDGDGLSDGDEVLLYGSDARHADSDRDGLSDAEEVATGLNPVNSDSDGDTLLDVDEIAAGLNPACADTDGDGLDDGAELLQRYKLVANLLTWPEAKVFAESRGGYLATVTSEEEIKKILSVVPGIGTVRPWLGAEETQEGIWEWVTGETFDFTNWSEGEPNNYKEPQMYLRFYRGTGWDDASPSTLAGTLIEFAEGLDPLNPDSDGDGLSDGDEVLVYRSDARVADTDGDGLSDGDEVAASLSPTLVDSDDDGIHDSDEPGQGLNPANADTDGDGLFELTEREITLTDPLLADSDANGVADLSVVQSINGADFISCYDSHISATWSQTGTAARVEAVYREPWVSYEITVTEPGIYHLAVHGDKASYGGYYENEIQMNIEVDACDAGLAQRGVVAGSVQYTIFTPWLTAGTHTIKVTLINQSGPKGAFYVNSLELGAVDGSDADGDGIDDWMSSLLDAMTDSDGDGITDLDEINVYGTSPTDADSDGDGLSDGVELEQGTDPLDDDSDDDGVVDGVEVYETFTSPLYAEFDGTSETVLSIPASQVAHMTGSWVVDGSKVCAEDRRGALEYVIEFPKQDLYCLNIAASHLWGSSSCTPMIPIDTSSFLIYVDDIFVGEYDFTCADEVREEVRAFLPMLPKGEHTIRIFWDNVYKYLSVQVQELQLQTLGGPDNNGNGTKDWIEVAINAMAGIDGISNDESGITNIESYISPACIEGDARYVPLMSIVDVIAPADSNLSSFVAAAQSVGARWYANLPLEEEGATTATVSFQNGALELPISVEWIPFNLIEHNGETLYIRKGDSVKLTALPAGTRGGQFTINVAGTAERSPNTQPLVFDFSEAGSYAVQGEYRKGNNTVTAAVMVNVLEGSFPEEGPACLIGKQRDWTFEGMPTNAVFEVDNTVEMSVESQATNSTLQTVSLKASEASGEHRMVARVSDNGPILDAVKLDTCWIQNAPDGYFWMVESFEDSELWEVESIQYNMPEAVDIRIKVFVAGVTFDDFAVERWITSSDYDELGFYSFRLIHPNDAETSTCHTFMVYQDGQFIGEGFSK